MQLVDKRINVHILSCSHSIVFVKTNHGMKNEQQINLNIIHTLEEKGDKLLMLLHQRKYLHFSRPLTIFRNQLTQRNGFQMQFIQSQLFVYIFIL